MPVPILTLIIVSYRSRGDLSRCLPSVYAQGVRGLQVIIVDNAQDDDTGNWIRDNYPQVELVRSDENVGYAGGCNLGLRYAKGNWVMFLNPDTELMPDSLAKLLKAVRARPDAIITPKLLMPNGLVNACGLEAHYTGIVSCRGLAQSSTQFTGLSPVAIASGAAIIAQKGLLEVLGGMDTSYFMYMEDVDLSMRAKLLGFEVLCEASAEVVHSYRLSMSPRKFELLERNRLVTLFKVFSARTLIRLVPALLLTEIGMWTFAVMRGPKYLRAKLTGYAWLFRNRTRWLSSRKLVQSLRKVSDRLLFSDYANHLPLGQLLGRGVVVSWLDVISRQLYRFSRPYAGG